jgi:hypothetical protein
MEINPMIRQRTAPIFGVLLLFGSVAPAQKILIRDNDNIVRAGVAVKDTRTVDEIRIPETSQAVEVRLQIDKPEQLDLDLHLYDADPANPQLSPLCVSDSIRGDEICAVKRPESGSVWAVVVAVDGFGKTPFTLTRELVVSSRMELALAEPISPNGIGSLVGAEGKSFQFSLDTKEMAAVVLEGSESTMRDMSVEDEEGHVFPTRKISMGRLQATVGEKFHQTAEESREVDWLLRGFKKPMRYLVRVGPSGNPYGQANTTLSIVQPGKRTEYAIAFSLDDLDDEPKTIDGPSRRLQRPGKGTPVLFRFTPRSALMRAWVIPSEIYDIAICDEYGFVVNIAPDTVFWDPITDSYQTRRRTESMYFVVFPGPFGKVVSEFPKLTLLIEPLR